MIACFCVLLFLDQLYAESQKECSGYKQQNDELVRQLSSLMRRLSPTDGATAATQQPAADNETETESAGKRPADDDAEKAPWLDFTEEGDREAASETAVSSPSFVNIDSSSSDDVSTQPTQRNVTVKRAQVSQLLQLSWLCYFQIMNDNNIDIVFVILY